MKIGHLLRYDDRMRTIKYDLTGDFGIGDYTKDLKLVGSIMMFDLPDGTPPLENGETVLGLLPLHLVGDIIRSTGAPLITIVKDMITADMAKLVGWARTSKVIVDLRHKDITTCSSEIVSLHPFSMSWSNLCDYFGYRKFHKMARSLSMCGDTIHFGYSMNWSQHILGANLLDYENGDQRKKLIKAAAKAVSLTRKMLGLADVLRCPPPTNSINTVCVLLASKYHTCWTDNWFRVAKESGPCNVMNVEPTFSNPFARASGLTKFTWTYDPQIKTNFSCIQQNPSISGVHAVDDNSIYPCDNCFKRVPRAMLLKCSRCKSSFYCDKACTFTGALFMFFYCLLFHLIIDIFFLP